MPRHLPPASRLLRLAKAAGLGARVGAEKVAGLLGGKQSEERIAAAASEVLGELRGLALKVGQLASYIDGFVPGANQEIYERVLASLRDAAPSMSAEAARRVVAQELGQSPEVLFAQWSATPFASASLGQVHSAVLNDGRRVAVKVQYEGIDKAVENELALGSLVLFLGPLGKKAMLEDQFREARARFLEELDYHHEAEAQAAFQLLFRADPQIGVPNVIREYCTRRVLTTQLVQGLKFDEACRADEPQRCEWAKILWRFAFESVLTGLFNADPHPGNYLFEEHRIWFLDFGCTKRLPKELVERFRDVHRAAVSLDERRFLEAARRCLGEPKSVDHARRMDDYFRLCFAPLLTAGPFRVTRPYARKLLEDIRANFLVLLKGSERDYAPLSPDFLFLNRLQLGFYSVLARLDVAVDYRELETAILAKIAA